MLHGQFLLFRKQSGNVFGLRVMSAAVKPMPVPIRTMMPTMIPGVAVIVAIRAAMTPSMVPVTAEIDSQGSDTDILRLGRPGIEKGYGGNQG
jgi:hypothetical protein